MGRQLEEYWIGAIYGGVMEGEISRGQLSNSRVPSHTNPSVLILDQNSAPCSAAKCDSLLNLLQKSLHIKCIQEENANRAREKLAPGPDLVLLRPPVGEAAQQLIHPCKEKWINASILAVLCSKWERLLEDSASLLTKVDDFLSCPFHEAELLLRVRRLLPPQGSKAISLEKPAPNKALHFGALVGKSESFVRAIKNIPPLAQ